MPFQGKFKTRLQMNIRILKDAETVAIEAAKLIAGMARQEVTSRGRFILAVSGGKTPWLMLRALGSEDVPWESVHVIQVDERIAPAGHPDRNLVQLRENLHLNSRLPENQIYAMPVETTDPDSAAKTYQSILCKIAGNPPVIDLVHLGLGTDGHTASLIPGDPVLRVENADVAITGIYQGRKRLTLTYPIINRSRNILWIVTGSEKHNMLRRMLDADPNIPAGYIRQDNALVMADKDAAGDIV
jgi:6-phosphogluconolactonase